jgi:hypothetical protein
MKKKLKILIYLLKLVTDQLPGKIRDGPWLETGLAREVSPFRVVSRRGLHSNIGI